jgi:hypothetical protein
MAEFERALIQERVRAGLRNAKKKGKRPGGPASLSIPQGQRPCALWALPGARSQASWAVGVGTLYKAVGNVEKTDL